MTAALALLMLFVYPAWPSASQPSIFQGDGWRLVFEENFHGNKLDKNHWTSCYWWDDRGCTNLATGEMQWYQPGNIEVADGALHLVARREQATGIDNRKFGYTSGIVTTGRYYREKRQPRFEFQYGYVEIRAKPPVGQGLWSALWLLPSTHKPLPEIDMMEVLGHAPDSLWKHIHYQGPKGRSQNVGHRTAVPDLSKDWNVYGVRWEPDFITWYLNGEEVWRYDKEEHVPKEPMYLLMNLAVGGVWGGPPDSTTPFPAKFSIDYVKIWQRQSQ